MSTRHPRTRSPTSSSSSLIGLSCLVLFSLAVRAGQPANECQKAVFLSDALSVLETTAGDSETPSSHRRSLWGRAAQTSSAAVGTGPLWSFSIHTHKRFKIMLLIRTKQTLNTSTAIQRRKTMTMTWRTNRLIFFGVSLIVFHRLIVVAWNGGLPRQFAYCVLS